ncbi:hypothetical protein JM93_00467 [Roseibium hamelinense]|uniref:Uncharacterized protein n=1 Tax=Roseibium hamelinense TaxID=150831 RepID=A0A562TH31_9HYPH|nr:hypothetical protein [Roseibium hamelinense]MTI45900.1 hypothetical protein [Roseibium hamelinense]TWI92915.1 hypothetical protein JM93_00467 [Roseibium hamelinense]
MQDQPKEDDQSASELNVVEQQRKKALARALKDVIRELKLVDVEDLIAYIRTDHHANISDIVRSSVEMFFKQDTLRYGMAASAEVDWDRLPTIALDLEFYHQGVWIYFTLVLSNPDNSINVSYVEVTNSTGDPEADMRKLIDALEDARAHPRF